MDTFGVIAEAVPRHWESKDWMTLVLIATLSLVCFVKYVYTYNFRRFSKVLVLNSYLFDDSVEEETRFNCILFIAHSLILSLGLYFLNTQFPVFAGIPVISFLKIFLLYVVFTVGKYLIEKILGTIFLLEETVGRYVYFKITLKNFLALVFFPILIILTYTSLISPQLMMALLSVFIGLNLFCLGIFYEKTRIINISNWYYIILYLCTFEIAPYFIIYKVIV